jgi:DNA-directed RNA polymerase specialized sigma24 family protein
VEKLLSLHYPRVCRIAYALCGKESNAKAAVNSVMSRSAHFLPVWTGASAAENWFLHHTLLAVRLAPSAPASPLRDCLIQHMNDPSAPYLAYVRAFRLLTPQQREAFILTRGERLDLRQLAVAMDCSSSAAANHLLAANQSMQSIAADAFDAQTKAMMNVYASLTPAEDLIIADISAAAGNAVRRRWRRSAGNILKLGLLALAAWTIWQLSRMIEI